jgi:hypothetical protein
MPTYEQLAVGAVEEVGRRGVGQAAPLLGDPLGRGPGLLCTLVASVKG